MKSGNFRDLGSNGTGAKKSLDYGFLYYYIELVRGLNMINKKKYEQPLAFDMSQGMMQGQKVKPLGICYNGT
jgi:hypothetical protein